MSDPLTLAVNALLWPYLKSEGFSKNTARKFARERNGVFQQLWVDANGRAGKQRTKVILCANLPFGPVNGYLDPHGFRIANDRSWSMVDPQAATASMLHIVETLKRAEIRKLDEFSSVETMLRLLDTPAWKAWYANYSALHQKWLSKDAEVLALVGGNRDSLKLRVVHPAK